MRLNLKFDTDNRVLCFAAEELKTYLMKIDKRTSITFNEPGIAIHLKNEPSLKVHGMPAVESSYLDDRFSVNILCGAGLIRGSNSRSVLIAVYKILERLGCRFLQPGRQYEVIPEKALNDFTYSFDETASLRYRGVCIEGANSLENALDFIDWLPKVGYNSFFIQFKQPYAFFERWHHHIYNPTLESTSFSLKDTDAFELKMDHAMKLRGLLCQKVGHGWTNEALGMPAIGWIPCKEEVSEEKRHLIAEISGKREYFKGIPANTNLCMSNPESIRLLKNAVVSYAQSHAEVDLLHFWLADEFNNVCECEECQQTTIFDQYVYLLNAIDKELTAKNIPTKICFLLYHELLWVPIRERLENPDRFVMMFAPISRTFEKSFSQLENLPPISTFQRNKNTLPTSLEENFSFLTKWQSCFQGDSFIYDYPLGRAHYGDLGYIHIAQIIYDDIKSLKNLGVNGYISCQELRSALPNSLPNYVMGRLLWDTSLEFIEIVEDYYTHAYGENWYSCLEYLRTLSNLSSCDYFNAIGLRQNKNLHKRYNQVENEVRTFKNTIQHAVETTFGLQKMFWERIDYHSNYCILLSQALSALSGGDGALAQKYWQAFMDYIRKNEAYYQDCLDVYRIIEVASNYTGFILNEEQD